MTTVLVGGSGQLQVLAALSPRRECQVPTGNEAGQAPEILAVLSSLILPTLIMEAMFSSETSSLRRATRHHIQKAEIFTVTAVKTSGHMITALGTDACLRYVLNCPTFRKFICFNHQVRRRKEAKELHPTGQSSVWVMLPIFKPDYGSIYIFVNVV